MGAVGPDDRIAVEIVRRMGVQAIDAQVKAGELDLNRGKGPAVVTRRTTKHGNTQRDSRHLHMRFM